MAAMESVRDSYQLTDRCIGYRRYLYRNPDGGRYYNAGSELRELFRAIQSP